MANFEKTEVKKTTVSAEDVNLSVAVQVDQADGSKAWIAVARVLLDDGTEAMGKTTLAQALTLEERTTFKALANKLRDAALADAGWIRK